MEVDAGQTLIYTFGSWRRPIHLLFWSEGNWQVTKAMEDRPLVTSADPCLHLFSLDRWILRIRRIQCIRLLATPLFGFNRISGSVNAEFPMAAGWRAG